MKVRSPAIVHARLWAEKVVCKYVRANQSKASVTGGEGFWVCTMHNGFLLAFSHCFPFKNKVLGVKTPLLDDWLLVVNEPCATPTFSVLMQSTCFIYLLK